MALIATPVTQSEPATATGEPTERGTASARRLASLDALRGFDLFWIIGGDALVHSVAALTGWPVATWAATQMTHVEWDGFHFYDLIFPLFVFIAGVAMPYSLSRRLEAGADRRVLVGHVVRRGLILVALGVVYNNGLFRIGFADMRYPSVLGRIGLAYTGAALIVLYTSTKGQVRWLVGLLVGYWLALRFLPVPGAIDGPFSMEGSLVGYVDRALVPGQLFLGVHDPEGLLSTLPAIGTGLSGALCGHLLRRADRSDGEKTLWLAGTGLAAVALGAMWHPLFPVNKNLWTSSFVLVTSGLSMLLLAGFFYLIDARGWHRWSFFFRVIGVNSILIYVAGHFVDFGYTTDFFLGGALQHLSENASTVVFWLGFIAMEWLFLWMLYRRRIFLKI
jgi:predicted acyltransferase